MRGCLWASILVCVLGDVSSTPCLNEEFTCVRGGCVAVEHVCDFKVDCEDGSDETYCKYENKINECVFLFFSCMFVVYTEANKVDGSLVATFVY